MNKPIGTAALLLRWHFLPFVVGVFLTLFSAYHLATYAEPKPSPLDDLVSWPLQGLFVPIMWALLATGVALAGRAVLKARAMAGK